MSYFKYILKGFKNNISRLLAIVAIITLGIGFLVGLSTSSTDIRTSVDSWYDETNVMDLNLKSTIGFSKDTVKELNDRADMDAEGVFQLEAKESFLNTIKVKSRLISMDLQGAKINQVDVIEGRFPLAENECVVLSDMDTYQKVNIGDKITVKDEKMDVDKTYTVTGIAKSPLFFAKDKEYNLTGTNRLDLIFFVDSRYNEFDLITDIYVKTTIDAGRFSGGYFDKLKKVENEIEEMDSDMMSLRRAEIKAEIKETILDTEFDRIKDEVDTVIIEEITTELKKEENYNKFHEEATKGIKDAIREKLLLPENYNKFYEEATKGIKDAIREKLLLPENYNKFHEEATKGIKNSIKEKLLLPENYNKIKEEAKNAALPEIRKTIEADSEKMAAIQAMAKKKAIDELKNAYYNNDPMLADQKATIDALILNGLNDAAKKELIAEGTPEPTPEEIQARVDSFTPERKKEINDATLSSLGELAWTYGIIFTPEKKAEINEAALVAAVEAGFEAKKEEIYAIAVNEAVEAAFSGMTQEDLDKAYNEAFEIAVETAFTEMSQEDLDKAYNEAFDTAVSTAFTEMDQKEKDDAYDTAVNEAVEIAYNDEILVNGEDLYVLNLKTNQSYISVKENSNKIDKIAVIFPVFFYFIAALVALTTITRLVDEERGAIGLFKSLGFSKFKILLKYLLFAFVCSVLGSLLGNLAGVYALPYVVYGAYKTILDLPPMVYTVEAMINGISVAMMILTIMGVATYVTLASLKEKPAELLQPKAPRPGKRLLLERWKGLWKRISFKYKNTIRNIFRYKKNLIMMMVGVGGCVGLLLTAFGIRDAFDTLASTQYDKIVTYDIRVNVDNGSLLPDSIINETLDNAYVNNKTSYIDGDDDYQISRIITNKDMTEFFSFNHDGKKVEFNPGDVIIDAQLAKEFNLKVGSEFRFDDHDKKYVVTGIFDNHIDNYVFIYDENLKAEDCNTYYLSYADGFNEDKVLEDLAIGNVVGVESISQKQKSFDTMLSSVVLILIVVIICSGALAVIVIYNLTNININERLKEIATLKVLGYQNREVYGYIYREIFVLTIFGILLGFLIGPFLYKFVMLNLNEPGLLFPTSVHPLNYLYSFLFTLLFAFIVDLILMRKIKNIKMVESLKCVE